MQRAGLPKYSSTEYKFYRAQVDPGKPEQFCSPLNGVQDGTTLRVTPYPIAWRIEIVEEDNHRGFEYVRSG